jgi:hypothetical protein
MKGASLSLGEMFERNRGHVRPSQLLTRHDATMSGDDPASSVYQDRYVHAEGPDAVRDLTDLAGRVKSRISWIEFELRNWSVNDLHALRSILVARFVAVHRGTSLCAGDFLG